MNNASVNLKTNEGTKDHNDDQPFADHGDMPNCVACGNDLAITEALEDIEDELQQRNTFWQ